MKLENLKAFRRKLLRRFELRPIHKVMRFLKTLDYLQMDSVLEVFGYKGGYHTLDYLKHVKHLTVWEIAQDCEADLKKNLPDATIKITNSYNEIKTTGEIFDTIVIDNHQGIFGDDKCEHFEIIEDCFKKLSDKSVLIANIIPDITVSKYTISAETQAHHIEKRKSFYKHETGTSLSNNFIADFYMQLADKNNFKAEHLFIVKRNYLVSYLVVCLQKKK